MPVLEPLLPQISLIDQRFICHVLLKYGGNAGPYPTLEMLKYCRVNFAADCLKKAIASGNLNAEGLQAAADLLQLMGK